MVKIRSEHGGFGMEQNRMEIVQWIDILLDRLYFIVIVLLCFDHILVHQIAVVLSILISIALLLTQIKKDASFRNLAIHILAITGIECLVFSTYRANITLKIIGITIATGIVLLLLFGQVWKKSK